MCKNDNTCGQCGKKCAEVYEIKTTKGTLGRYCSRGCAKADMWGPVFRGATVRKKRSK